MFYNPDSSQESYISNELISWALCCIKGGGYGAVEIESPIP